MKKVLYIDTRDRDKALIGLFLGNRKILKEERKKSLSSQIVLTMIEEILQDQKLVPEDLTGVTVEIGPGSFTGIRVGLSIANALAFSLNIPVNGKKQIIEPKYE